jgi:hypothetical protein
MRQDQADSAKRHRAVAHAQAQQRLEGLDVPPEVLDDLHRAAKGEISVAEGIAAVYHRYGQPMPVSATEKKDGGGRNGD